MEAFGVISLFAILIVIGGFAGGGIGRASLLDEIKRDCERHGAMYVKDIRYSCKKEDNQPAKEQSK